MTLDASRDLVPNGWHAQVRESKLTSSFRMLLVLHFLMAHLTIIVSHSSAVPAAV